MTLLVVDDNRSVLAAVKLLAEIKFDNVMTTTSPSRIPALLREGKPDCVLLDMNFTSPVTNGNEGLFWLSEIHRLSPSTPVVLFTAFADIELAVQGLKEGAADFVTKPWNNARLLQTLLQATNRQAAARTKSPEHHATDDHNDNPTPLTLHQMEQKMISEALADNGGNLSAAAAQLGISRQTLYNKIKSNNNLEHIS
ncbi:MAG: DNA-binding response regulator [Bacteroides sp.]|nr:DNA-binding response regulator [Bacteroides sp.]